jgi:UDPglucose--hexose-1-phosphate uridylyltransferase
VPELRRDALSGEVVLVAPGRAARPHTSAAREAGADATADCPFCPGSEDQTPPELARTGGGEPNRPGWRVRAFANLYPFVGEGPGATGAHEVVVLSPDHDRDLARLEDDAAVEAFTMLRERSRVHAAAGHAYVQVAVNEGREAGASLAHPHAQVVAVDFVPPAVEAALARFSAADADLVVEDHARAAAAESVVLTRSAAVAWCGAASSVPFEVRVAALGAGPRFGAATDDELAGVALAVRDGLRRVGIVLAGPAYNVVVHDAPTPVETRFHWWVRLIPRVVVPAGFELGTGVLVEPVEPRQAAAQLRAAG